MVGMLAVMAVLRVLVLVLVRVRGRVARVLVVLRVGRRVVVVVVVVRRRVLRDLAVLGMVAVELHCVCYLCCVVQVGRVGLVGYEGGLTAGRVERRVALGGRFASLAAEERPEDGSGCRVGDGGGVAAGCALAWRGGSPARVWTANDGPLQEGKKKVTCMSVRHCASPLNHSYCTRHQQDELTVFLLQINK